MLLYVPAPDQEQLLSAFDFAVLPIPLVPLGEYDGRGRMLRHDADAVKTALGDALKAARVAAGEIKQRTARRAESDALLLPPINFRTGDCAALEEMFRDLRSGRRPPQDRFPNSRSWN